MPTKFSLHGKMTTQKSKQLRTKLLSKKQNLEHQMRTGKKLIPRLSLKLMELSSQPSLLPQQLDQPPLPHPLKTILLRLRPLDKNNPLLKAMVGVTKVSQFLLMERAVNGYQRKDVSMVIKFLLMEINVKRLPTQVLPQPLPEHQPKLVMPQPLLPPPNLMFH